jgi:hypothetical protein
MNRRRIVILVLALLLIGLIISLIFIFWPKGPKQITSDQPKEGGNPIDKLTDNYEVFEKVAEHIDKTYVSFYLYETSERLSIVEGGNSLSDRIELDIGELEITAELEYLLDEMYVKSIQEWDDYIVFSIAGAEYGGWGVKYMRNDKVPKNTTENPHTYIKGNWYYYEFYGT